MILNSFLSKIRGPKKRRNKGTNTIISSTMLAGAVIALSFVTLTWTYQRTQLANMEYSEAITSESYKMKEKIVIEYTYYSQSEEKLNMYLLNCGQTNSVRFTNIVISNSSWAAVFPIEELKLFNGTSITSLNVQEHAYFETSTALTLGTQYSLRIITERERSFETVIIP